MDSESESEEYSQQVRGIAATIILINIFDPNSHKSSQQAHVATCRLLRHYLRTQNSQYLGVVLYGTDEDNTSIFALKNAKIMIPLTSPTLNDYHNLESTKVNSIKQSKELELSEVLGHCNKMFTGCKKTFSTRTIVMLTALDEAPPLYDQNPTLESVVDLVDSGIQIKMVNIANSDYEIDQFYKDFLFEANKGQDVILPKRLWDIEEIEKELTIQCHRHVALELSFEICKDVTMGVKLYNMLKSQTEPKSSYFHRETNASVTRSYKTMKYTNQTNMDVDQIEEEEPKQVPLLKTEVLQSQEYGDEKIEFTDIEMTMMKNPFESNILKLLGFKPSNILQKEKWFIERCYFLFPSEQKIEGSTIAFKALYRACTEMKVVAICIMNAKKNSKPRIVALSPCTTKPFGLNVDIGFDVIILPFAENVRDLPVVEDNISEDNDEENIIEDKGAKNMISNEQKTIVKDIVKEVMFDYKPEMFENPMLQSKYRLLEAKALKYTDIEDFHDTTKPSEKIFENLDGDTFYKVFGPFGVIATKRTSERKSTTQKKAKVEVPIDEDLLRNNIANKNIDKQYTADQLRQILRNLNITKLPRKKDDLVKLVYENYA